MKSFHLETFDTIIFHQMDILTDCPENLRTTSCLKQLKHINNLIKGIHKGEKKKKTLFSELWQLTELWHASTAMKRAVAAHLKHKTDYFMDRLKIYSKEN